MLARDGLVEADESADGRERPWRATVTGFSIGEAEPGSVAAEGGAALLAASVQLDQRLSREYLSRRSEVDAQWRAADAFATYALQVTPQQLTALVAQLDGLIRPLIATRADAPGQAELVHLSLQAFPRQSPP